MPTCAGIFALSRPTCRATVVASARGRDSSIEECADHIVALADSLGIGKFIACGYSMGGLVAQQFWRRHPDRISGLVLAAASRNFLGSTVERMVSSFSPAFAIAAQANPFLRVLPADAFGLG